MPRLCPVLATSWIFPCNNTNISSKYHFLPHTHPSLARRVRRRVSPPSAGIHVALSRSSVTALHSCAVAAGSLSLPGLTSLPHSFHALAVSLTTSCRPLLHTALTRLTEDCALASVLVACQDPDAIADGLAGARHRKDRFPSHARRSRPCRGARNRRSLWRGVYPGCVDVVLELCHPRPINIYLHPRPLPHSHTILIISCIGRGSCSLCMG